MNINLVIQYWLKNSQEKWKTTLSLYKSRRYSDCLFFCHLTLECLLKALVVKRTGKIAPYIHDLERLADLGKLKLSEEERKPLQIITHFNLEARYPEYKLKFYKAVNKTYADKYFKISKKLMVWLNKKLNI